MTRHRSGPSSSRTLPSSSREPRPLGRYLESRLWRARAFRLARRPSSDLSRFGPGLALANLLCCRFTLIALYSTQLIAVTFASAQTFRCRTFEGSKAREKTTASTLLVPGAVLLTMATCIFRVRCRSRKAVDLRPPCPTERGSSVSGCRRDATLLSPPLLRDAIEGRMTAAQSLPHGLG